MNILIRKAGFVNKGAQLMLYACVAEVKRVFPDANIVIEPTSEAGAFPFSKYARHGFFPRAYVYRFGVNLAAPLSIFPKKLREFLGIVIDKEIDLVLDAAGFAYSDQFGIENCNELRYNIKKFSRHKTRYILLPQAFGPFVNNKMRQTAKEALNLATFVYARDRSSMRYLSEIGITRAKLCGDFTNLLQGELVNALDVKRFGNFPIIPNTKVYEKQKHITKNDYINFIIMIFDAAEANGYKPYFLNHEGRKDNDLISELLDRRPHAQALRNLGALEIKHVIGSSQLVFSSRFHGIVSGLAQGVPVISTGWSHKYKELFEDYNFHIGLLSEADASEKISKTISEITRHLDTYKANLNEHSELLKRNSGTMWAESLVSND
jgi:colanic acid/amylovoran biosynthesis protein